MLTVCIVSFAVWKKNSFMFLEGCSVYYSDYVIKDYETRRRLESVVDKTAFICLIEIMRML